MTNNKHNKKDTLNNTIKSVNKVKLNMYQGVLDGNIIDQPLPTTQCDPYSLQFKCEDNSQYIPLV